MMVLRAMMALLLVAATYLAVIEMAIFIFEGKKIIEKPKKRILSIKRLV